MEVNISDYGDCDNTHFIVYVVSGLTSEQLTYLDDNLEEKTAIEDDNLKITMYFDDFYPFGSDVAKFRLDDFVAREEIEMNVFLSGFLEDV